MARFGTYESRHTKFVRITTLCSPIVSLAAGNPNSPPSLQTEMIHFKLSSGSRCVVCAIKSRSWAACFPEKPWEVLAGESRFEALLFGGLLHDTI